MSNEAKLGWAAFSGLNQAFLVELYERYRSNPASVDREARLFFDQYGPPPVAAVGAAQAEQPMEAFNPSKIAAAIALGRAIREYGYRAARLDPLGGPSPGDRELLPTTHGLEESDLAALPSGIIGGPVSQGAPRAVDSIGALRLIYQGTSGYEFEHVSDDRERAWLRNAVETGRFRPPRSPIDARKLLERLTQVEAFERFLQSAYPAQTRFSIEGLDMLVPMLDEVVGAAAEAGTQQVILGMAHRGRLNVLAHVAGMPYAQILAEFGGGAQRPNISASGSSDLGWTGDVKYHLGARNSYQGGREVDMLVTLVPNPSHLEFVDPVVQGMARAAGENRAQPGPARLDQVAALPVLIHGDAAMVGEGVTAESLNLSRLPGYMSGGAIHIVANNQLGFTTPPQSGRSTLFASDLAKGFEIPIVHVNADDVEACIAAVRLAHEYIIRFQKDFLIDLIGYRRWGHNEGDEPSFTQPLMYLAIGQHPMVREIWAQEVAGRGVVTSEEAAAMLRRALESLHSLRLSLPKEGGRRDDLDRAGLEAGGVSGGLGHEGPALEVKTAVEALTLRRLNQEMLILPPDFSVHPKLSPVLARRKATLLDGGKDDKGAGLVEWAHAEALAFASILADGTPVRLTGQDTARGTFSQRHMVLHDTKNASTYIPLQHITSAHASFDVWDSPLSEQATMGFEFGYGVQAPEGLVLWEAQYGDFVNAAQASIDEFVVSARSKWGQRSSLVLLLPHGYEGQGPDHSSARLERFLQMAAEDNVRIANPSTAAQYFHILRRQVGLFRLDPRPLVLLTPKSLLRNPAAASRLEDLVDGRFHLAIDDARASWSPDAVRRLILCSGKIYYDLSAAVSSSKQGAEVDMIAIARVEELYPFPAAEIEQLIGRYNVLEEVVWVQEEPRNMGAWTFVAPRLRDLLAGRLPLLYIGRTRRASPAEGSYEWHLREQKRIVDDALLRFGTREVAT